MAKKSLGVTSLFYFSAGVNTNRPWSSCTPHITAYLSSSDRRVLSGRGKYTRRGFNRSYTSEQETAVSFGPHLTTAWSGRGNGDLRVVSCACEKITEIRDKDNCVLCVRWARIDVPGDPPRPSSRRKYSSIIRYFAPFFPQTKHFDISSDWEELHGSDGGGKRRDEPACVQSSRVTAIFRVVWSFFLYLFSTLFSF